jgi:23S rRNA G2445 N2-methylase RlmL
LPQGYCQEFGIDPDFDTNGIVLCENAHIKVLHPDADEAKRDFRNGDKQAFEKLRKERSDKLKERVPYWVTDYDRALYATAVRNTQRAKKKGWFWPLNGKQKDDIDDSYKK